MPDTDLLSVEFCQHLIYRATHELLAGDDVDPLEWRVAKAAYDYLGFDAENNPLPDYIIACGELARVITAGDAAAPIAAAARIPLGPEHSQARAVAEGVLAHRAVEAMPNAAPPYSRLATSLFELGRFHRTAEEYLLLHRRMIQALERFFELCVSDSQIRGALSEASTLVGAASQLAGKCGVPEYLEEALLTGARVIALNHAAEGASAMGVWTLCNNMQNIYRWLIRDQPAATAHYDLRRLEIASSEMRALAAAGPLATIPMRERTFRSIAALHARLAGSQPDQRDGHIRQARQAIAACAALSDDAEFRKRIAVLNEQLERQLAAKDLPSEQVVPQVEDYDALMLQFRERARKAAAAIAGHTSDPERQHALASVLDEWYSELTKDAIAVVVQSGLDYDFCKALLVLGACVDGRLGPVSYEAVRVWRWRFEEPDPNEKPEAAAIRARQYLPISGESDATRQKVWGRLAGLSELRENLRPTFGAPLSDALSSRNATLLKNVLTIWPCVQHVNDSLQATDDVRALLKDLPSELVSNFVDAYRS